MSLNVMDLDIMNPEICLLGDNSSDRNIWQSFLKKVPDTFRDVHYSAEYLDIYRKTYNSEGYGIYYKNGDLEVLQPIIVRRINDLQFISQNQSKGMLDVESPYGFGGALANRNVSLSELENYQDHKSKFLETIGAVTEFCSYHPLFVNKECEENSRKDHGNIELVARKRCAYIDLRQDFIAFWSGIEERQRKAITNARRRNIKIRRECLSNASIGDFYYSYIATMNRVDAGNEWKFPKSYFTNCRDCLGEGACSLFNAYINDNIVASFFLIHLHGICYYHFSCSNPEYSSANANHLLLFDTTLWAKAQGYDFYFLGGGYSAMGDDGLYRFKQSFTPLYKTLYQSKQIFDANKYNDLKKMKIAFDKAKGNPLMDSQFFPYYRS